MKTALATTCPDRSGSVVLVWASLSLAQGTHCVASAAVESLVFERRWSRFQGSSFCGFRLAK